jgi:hypothetical protein
VTHPGKLGPQPFFTMDFSFSLAVGGLEFGVIDTLLPAETDYDFLRLLSRKLSTWGRV